MRPGERRLPSRLFFVADATHAPEGLPALFERAAAAGLNFLELRRKEGAGTAQRVDEARDCLAAAPRATVLINDRLDVALAAGAQGLHVGQEDLPPEQARELLGPEGWLGLSTHDEEQFARARERPVDYLALGPIYESATKSGHAEPVGLEALRRCCATTSLPIVAIGGLDPDRARLALEAGAAAVAVASALALGDLEANARAFRDACGEGSDRHWVLTGLPGSGKTTVGRELARRSGRPFVDLDDLVEAATGLSVSEVFAQRGEAAFREEERRALERQLNQAGPPAVVALGGGALNVAGCREALDRSGARVAWLDLAPEACAHRLARSSVERPLLAHARGPELAAELERLLSLRWAAYAGASLKVDAAAGAGPVAEELLRSWST